MTDLDELLLSARRSEGYERLAEAVACYQSRALRAAIVMTWQAAVFDIVGKLRELALASDGQAKSLLEQLDKAHGNPKALGAFESDILEAIGPLELLDESELRDLERLQQDRHLCAHPSFAADGREYAPPPELVRLHVRNATVHLLCRPPVQGKAALERLKNEVARENFPSTPDGALHLLETGPLVSSRESVVSNFFKIMVGEFLVHRGFPGRDKFLAAAVACFTLKPSVCLAVAEKTIDRTIQRSRDEREWEWLHLTTRLLSAIPDCQKHLKEDTWRFLEDECQRESYPSLSVLRFALSVERLKKSCKISAPNRSAFELAESLAEHPSEIWILDIAVEKYAGAGTYADANSFGRIIIDHAGQLNAAHLAQITTVAFENSQCVYASCLERLIDALDAQGKRFNQPLPQKIQERLRELRNWGTQPT